VLVPFAESVYFVDLQVKQAQFSVETKTRDNVFVQIPVSVQYQVLEDKIFDAFYKLSAPQKQIESFVFNSILGHVPKLTLDETFEQQSGISVAVKVELDSIMSGFGFNILTALVTDIVPDVKVKAAMNDINAAQRSQVAAQARGEADKILKVKQAEAEAESKALQGKGIAAERQAIIDGLRLSIEGFQSAVPGATAEDVMALVLLTQYFDTLRDIGTRGGTNTLFLPNSPGSANDFMGQIVAGIRGGQVPVTPPPVASR
jgi:regulator of protease activity HflC (stomatin/prohibitin superfamily)